MTSKQTDDKGKKDEITQILARSPNLLKAQRLIEGYPPKRAINSLIRLFYHGEPRIRWWAISLFGDAMARLANDDIEAARIIIRRLMWSLNDESGGIGWGAPEAMAEAMACHQGLAEEYVQILLSYIWEDGNFLEHDPLRKGALWGVMRLSTKRPWLLRNTDALKLLRPYLSDPDHEVKVLSALAISKIGIPEQDCPYLSLISSQISDDNEVVIYLDGIFLKRSVKAFFNEAEASLCRQ